MPDTYRITAPDGTVLKMQLDAPPTDAQALEVVRSYGDAQAATAQKKAEDRSNYGGKLVTGIGNAILDYANPVTAIKSIAASPFFGSDTVDTGPTSPEKMAQLRTRSFASQAGLGNIVKNTVGDVGRTVGLDDSQAGSNPETVGRTLGTLATMGAAGRLQPKINAAASASRLPVGSAIETGGTKLTNLGESLQGTEPLFGAGGAVLGGAAGNTAGAMKGYSLGKAVPSSLQTTGKLITRIGQAIKPTVPPIADPYMPNISGYSAEQEVPYSGRIPVTGDAPPPTDPNAPPPGVDRYLPNVSGTPTSDVPIQTERVPLTGHAQPPGGTPSEPPPRLVKGENPSLEDSLMAALEEVRGQQSGAGTTPPDVTMTSAGKPSVTPERAAEIEATAPPAGTARGELPERQPTQGVLRTEKPAAVEPEPAGNPHGELTEDELNMVRQIAAENDAIRYSGRNYNPIPTRHGGNIEVSGGAGGAESLGLVKGNGGYGSRANMIEEANNVIDGTGKSNANTRAIIQSARDRLAGEGGPATDLPPDAWKYYETPRELEARQASGAPSPAIQEAQAGQQAPASNQPFMRSALIEEVLRHAQEQGIPVDAEALQRGLADPEELVNDLANKYRQGGESADFDPAAMEGGAPTPAAAVTPAAPPADVVLPGTEAARQVGKADVTFKAPQQASGEDFSLDARTADQMAADEAAAAKQAEGPSMFDEAPEGPAEGPANPQRFESEQGWKKFVKGFAKGMTDEDIRSWFKEHNYDGVSIEGKEGPKVYSLDEVGKTLPETPGAAKAQTAEGKPDRSGRTAEENQRDEIAARDLARKLSRGGEEVTTEDVRNRNRERMTGKVGEKGGLPKPRVTAINAKLKEMLDRNATDQEFEDYLDAGQEHSKQQVGLLIQTALENAGRKSIVALAGAAAGGAALRQALVGQLQKKDESQ